MIRLMNEKDIPGVLELLQQVLYVHHVGRPDIFKEKGTKYTEDHLKEMISNPSLVIFVYEADDGKIIGHCFCSIIDRPETTNSYSFKTLFINDLCIDESNRGKHIGKSLYEHAKKYAKENGFYNINLNVWECNPSAMAFYKAMGLVSQSHTMEEILRKNY